MGLAKVDGVVRFVWEMPARRMKITSWW
jgi:hypothetical protein